MVIQSALDKNSKNNHIKQITHNNENKDFKKFENGF